MITDTQKINSAIAWKTTDIFLQKIGGFVVSIILARLIAPEEFGQLAMILFFSGLAGLFVDSGFSSALIQKKEHTYRDECTVFWFNIFSGTFIAAALVFAAPWIAQFYGFLELKPLVWLLAANLWLSSSIGVHTALLSKKLNFKIQMKAGVIATFFSGMVAILLAFKGWGVWALAAQIITATIINVSLLWLLHDWRPKWVFSWNSLRNLFGFGGFMLLSAFLDNLATRIYALLVGKFYSPSALGFFNRAASTKDLPQGVLAGIFSSIAFPVFSSFSDDKARLREGLRVALVAMMAINLPVMLGLLVTADTLVPALFGSRWEPAVPILKILCGVGALWPLQTVNLNVLMAQGHSNLFFRLELIKKVLLIIVVIIASQISVIAIAWGMFGAAIFAYFINVFYTQKFLDYGILQQLKDITPYIILSVVMSMLVLIAGGVTQELPIVFRLLTQIIVGSVFYSGFAYVFRLEVIRLAFNLIGIRNK